MLSQGMSFLGGLPASQMQLACLQELVEELRYVLAQLSQECGGWTDMVKEQMESKEVFLK